MADATSSVEQPPAKSSNETTQLDAADQEFRMANTQAKSEFDNSSSLARPSSDLVGRRVLCLPKTFNVPTPSPVQVSSSLWSSSLLDAIAEMDKTNASSKCKPLWCPRHHHHHQSQQSFLSLYESLAAERLKSDPNLAADRSSRRVRGRSRSATSVGCKNSPSNPSRQSYSVMRNNSKSSLHLDLPTTTSNNSSDMSSLGLHNMIEDDDKNLDLLNSDDQNICEMCQTYGPAANKGDHLFDNEMGNKLNHLNGLPWRIGTIRAVGQRNLNDKSLSLLIEFDLLDWQARDWYHIHQRPRDEESDKEKDNQEDVCSTSRAAMRRESPSKQSLAAQAQEIKSKKSLARQPRQDCDVTGKPAKRRSKSNEDGDGNDERERSRSSPSFSYRPDDGLGLEPKRMKSEGLEFTNKGGRGDGASSLAPGDFEAVLVEHSMCCLNRRNSPTGPNRLWSALVSVKRVPVNRRTLSRLQAWRRLEVVFGQCEQ